MPRSLLAFALLGVALAGAWWTTSCLLDGCSLPTTTATAGFAVGGVVAYAGLDAFRRGDGRLTAAGFALNGTLILPMLVLEFPGLGAFALSFAAVALGLLLAALATYQDAPKGRVKRLRLALAIVGLGTLYWLPDKVLRPDLATPPYLIAPAAFLVATIALGAHLVRGAGAPLETAGPQRHQSR